MFDSFLELWFLSFLSVAAPDKKGGGRGRLTAVATNHRVSSAFSHYPRSEAHESRAERTRGPGVPSCNWNRNRPRFGSDPGYFRFSDLPEELYCVQT